MSILPATNTDPVGAVALLGHADPDELERFIELENAVWDKTALPSTVIEAVRLHCAQIRGCVGRKNCRKNKNLEIRSHRAHNSSISTEIEFWDP